MKNIITALEEAGFTGVTIGHTSATTDYNTLRYTNSDGYTVDLRHASPNTLNRLIIGSIKALGSGKTVIDLRPLHSSKEYLHIKELHLRSNNQWTLKPRPLSIDQLNLRNSIIEGLATLNDSTLETTPLQAVQQLTLENSTLIHATILNSVKDGVCISLEESDLRHLRLYRPGGAYFHFHRTSCCGNESYPQSFTLTRGLSYTEHNSPQITRAKPLYVLADAPAGRIINLAGQRIRYATYLNDKGGIHLKLGCWDGSLKEARALIKRPADQWPSFPAALSKGCEPRGDAQDLKAARKRYRALFKHIHQTMKALPVPEGLITVSG